MGESQLELLEPTEAGSVIARFLEKRSGLHHVCVLVDDIDAALAELKARGVPLVDETPASGRRRLPRRLRAPEGRLWRAARAQARGEARSLPRVRPTA